MIKFRNPFKRKRETKSPEERGIPQPETGTAYDHEPEYMDTVDTEEETRAVDKEAIDKIDEQSENVSYPHGLHDDQHGIQRGLYRDKRGIIRAIGRA